MDTGVGEVTLALRFAGVVERAYKKTGEGVVILVDEYDKPMLQAIGERKLQVEFRSTLKSFYSVLKTMDRYIRFALLTGVTKFGKVSVFSDLNNLNDISMYEPFVSICGMTEKEIHDNLDEKLHAIMHGIHAQCVKYGTEPDGYINYVKGANIAGFMKVAHAMMGQGII